MSGNFLYRLLVSVGAGLKVLNRRDMPCSSLFSRFCKNIKQKKLPKLSDDFFLSLVSQNFRLKTKIKLGRSSSSVYRKFYEQFKASKSYSQEKSVIERKRSNYLLIRDGAMGDVLMLTPIIRELHLLHEGEILIDVATYSRNVFDNNPFVARVLDPNLLSKGIRTYDVVIDLNDVYERSKSTHPVNAYAKCVFGKRQFDRQLDIYCSENDVEFVDKAIAEIGAPFLIVHYFKHDWPNREIKNSVFHKLLLSLAESAQYKIVFIGVDRDRAIEDKGIFIDHRGRYSIQQLKLLIDKSIGFLGGDSGPSHVAAATSAPMAVFYTCAHHEDRMPLRQVGRFMPITPNVECYGCLTRNPIPRPGYLCERGDNACTSSFDIESLKVEISSFFNFKTEPGVFDKSSSMACRKIQTTQISRT